MHTHAHTHGDITRRPKARPHLFWVVPHKIFEDKHTVVGAKLAMLAQHEPQLALLVVLLHLDGRGGRRGKNERDGAVSEGERDGGRAHKMLSGSKA